MNNQELFTSEEFKENEARKHELIELVTSGEAVLIVGAGSSARLKYVTWKQLMNQLEHLAGKTCGFEPGHEKRQEGLLVYAQAIKSHICASFGDLGKYHDFLFELFQPKSPAHDDFHRMLVELPVRGILTTNYDTVLEAALSKKKREIEQKEKEAPLIDVTPLVIGKDPPRLVHEFLLSKAHDPKIPQRIAHLHGMYRNPDSIVLTSDDYSKSYGLHDEKASPHQRFANTWTLHRKLLWAILATRRVIFVGFSMEDPYFNKMLETVSADLWGWNKSIHFAIMRISRKNTDTPQEKADRLKDKYSVDTVFYEAADDANLGLYHIVAEIHDACHLESQRTVRSTRDRLDNNDRTEGEKSKLATRESQDLLNSLDQANKRMLRRITDENQSAQTTKRP